MKRLFVLLFLFCGFVYPQTNQYMTRDSSTKKERWRNIIVSPVSLSGNTTVDWKSAVLGSFTDSLSTNKTYSFVNLPSMGSITIRVSSITGQPIVTWPANISWTTGTPPSQDSAPYTTVYHFESYSGSVYGWAQKYFPVVSSPPSGSGDTSGYFVSKSTGNDASSGTYSAPWASLANINGRTFTAGTTIYLKRGDTLTEALTPRSANITFAPYGVGADPVISGFATVPNAMAPGWASQGDTIWSISLASNPQWVWLNGVLYNFDSLQNINSRYRWGYQGGNLYVYANGTSPQLYYGSITYPLGVSTLATITNIRGVTFRHITFLGGGVGVVADGARRLWFDSCSFLKTGVWTIQAKNASDSMKITDCTFDNADTAYHRFEKGFGVYDQLHFTGSSYDTIIRNKFYNAGHDAINLLPYDVSSRASIGSTSHEFISQNEYYAPGDYSRFIDFHSNTSTDNTGNIVSRNYLHNFGNNSQFAGNANQFIYNIIDTVKTKQTNWTGSNAFEGRGITTFSGETLTNLVIANNTFMNCDDGGIRIAGAASGTVVENNKLENTGINVRAAYTTWAAGQALWIYSATTNGVYRNNQIYNAVSSSNVVKYHNDGGTDSNITVATFNTKSGFGDVVSGNISTQSVFNGVAGATCLKPRYGSAGMDAGYAAGYTPDYAGVTVPVSVTDIGAYENQLSDTATLAKPTIAHTDSGTNSVTVRVTPNGAGRATKVFWAYGTSKDTLTMSEYGTYQVPDTANVASSFTISSLNNGVKYYFAARSWNGVRYSSYSNYDSATTLASSWRPDTTNLRAYVSAYKQVGLSDGDAPATVYDSSGKANNFTQSTAGRRMTYKTGGQGGKQYFQASGLSSATPSVYDCNALGSFFNYDSSWTITAVLDIDSLYNTSYHCVGGAGTSSGSANFVLAGFYQTGANSSQRVYFDSASNVSTALTNTLNTTDTLGTHIYTWTHQSISQGDSVKMYIDGVLKIAQKNRRTITGMDRFTMGCINRGGTYSSSLHARFYAFIVRSDYNITRIADDVSGFKILYSIP